jgi:hypothetical protein
MDAAVAQAVDVLEAPARKHVSISPNQSRLSLLIFRSLGTRSRSTPRLTQPQSRIEEVALPLDLARTQVQGQGVLLSGCQ